MSSVTLTFKLSGSPSFDITCEKSINVAELKSLIVTKSSIPTNNQRLIYKGKILKDEDILSDLKVEDGHTVHVVRSGVVPSASADAASTTAAPVAATEKAAAPVVPGDSSPQGHGNIFDMMNGFNANSFNAFNGGAGAMFGGNENYANMVGSDPEMGMDASQFANILNNPVAAQMLDQLISQPGFMRQIIESNPTLSQMVNSNPQMMAMFENPGLMRMLLNPEVLQASAQLNRQFNSQGMGAGSNGLPDMSALASMFGGGSGGGFGGNMFPQFGASNAAASGAQQTADMYTAQLEQLNSMGFIDRDANIEALFATNGNVNDAISYLLERGIGN